MAAERTVANDVSMLQSLSNSSGSMRSPNSPVGRTASPGQEPNGSVKSSAGRPTSPAKEDRPLLCDKEDKATAEERTVLLSASGGASKC